MRIDKERYEKVVVKNETCQTCGKPFKVKGPVLVKALGSSRILICKKCKPKKKNKKYYFGFQESNKKNELKLFIDNVETYLKDFEVKND